MKKIMIHLDTFEKIKNYIDIVENLDCEIILTSERYVVNGKSILGILSLDLSEPVEIHIDYEKTSNDEECTKILEKFIV